MATAPPEVATDSGITLKKRVLSTPEVLAQSVANMAPSAAMALLPFLVFLSAGNGTWLAFAFSLVVLLIVGYCAAQFATRINSAGSFYVWVTRSIGPGAGSAAGWGLVLGYLFTGVATVLGFEIYGYNFLVGWGLAPSNHLVRALLYIVAGVTPALMATADIKISQRVAFILEGISVTIILILCIAVYVHSGGIFDSRQLSLKGAGAGGIVVGMVLAIFAFVGFESAGSLGQEAKNPSRSVPRAILWSCGIVGVFYLIVSYAQVYGFGDAAFGKATAPLPQLASAVNLGWLGHFIAFGITCSMFACTLACLTAGSRMLLSLGHDGLLPKVFTHTSRHTHAPSVAIWSVAVPMTVDPHRLHRRGQHRHGAHRGDGHAGDLRLHAGLRPGRARRADLPEEDRRAEAARLGAGHPRHGDDGVRLLRQLDPAGDIERHLPGADLALLGAALRVPRLDRARAHLVLGSTGTEPAGRGQRRGLGRARCAR